MKFSDDIALGQFPTIEFAGHIEEQSSFDRVSKQVSTHPSIKLSIVLSVAVHCALAATLYHFLFSSFHGTEQLGPGLIRVDFTRSNPLLTEPDEGSPDSIVKSSESISADEQFPTTSPIDNSAMRSDEVSASDVSGAAAVEVLPRENSGANSSQAKETIAVPTVESVRRALSELHSDDGSRFYTYDCNKLEEAKEFNDCVPNEDRDYSAIVRNPVYDFHNPAVEVSRSRETVTTLARHSGRVAEQLALSGLPTGLSNYVLEEVEQGIELYSNNSSRALEHMSTMVDKSASGMMARRVFDSWVQQQMTVLGSRSVENQSDTELRERCRSHEKYIMAPTEFARCLSIGEGPLGFTIKF